MKNIIRNILKQELNEGVKDVVIGLASLLTLGISKVQAQQIKDNQPKLKLADTLILYNKNPKGYDSLKQLLLPKIGKNTDIFIEKYLNIKRDGTVILKPNFVDNLEIDYNPRGKNFEVHYTIKF